MQGNRKTWTWWSWVGPKRWDYVNSLFMFLEAANDAQVLTWDTTDQIGSY